MFGPSFPLFKLFGFQVKVDLSWFIIAVLITWSLADGVFPYYFPNLAPASLWVMGVAGALGLFLSIVLHELGHSVVAERQGLPMRGITLFIFGGVAEMSGEPPSAKAEFLLAIAGPIVSLLLGLGLLALWLIPMPDPVRGVLAYLGVINLLLVAFNLIPAFPLDGGRVLRSILWYWKGNFLTASRIASRIGTIFGFILIALGIFRFITGHIFGGIWYGLIGLFLRGAANASYQQALMRGILHGQPIENFMNAQPRTVDSHITIQTFIDDYVYRYHHRTFPVVDDGQLLGLIELSRVMALPKDQWPWHHVHEFIARASADNTVDRQTDAMEVLMTMSRDNQPRLLVVEGSHLLGIVSMRDLLQYVDLKSHLEQTPNRTP